MLHARDDYDRIQDPDGIIPDDEPVFLLRGQDEYAPFAVSEWADMVDDAGGDQVIVQAARDQAQRMWEWQREHGSKRPDLPPGAQTR